MSRLKENKNSMRNYLLGELSEQERERLEQQLMSDDGLYQELLIAEDELIDDFVADALPETARENFARHFLNVPELKQNVRFAIALRKHAQRAASQKAVEVIASPIARLLDWLRKFFMRPLLVASLAAALLASGVLAVLLAAKNSQLRAQIKQLQAQQSPPTSQQDLQEQLAAERLRNEQLSSELSREQERRLEEARKAQEANQQPQPTITRTPTPPETSRVVAITLTPGLIRDSGAFKKLPIPPNVSRVILKLDLPAGGYASYRAVLKTVDGQELLSRQGLRDKRRNYVTLNISAKLLSHNDYQVILNGVNSAGEEDEVGKYYFRVPE